MNIWYLEYELQCGSEQLLLRRLKEERLNVRNIVSVGGQIHLTVPFFYRRKAEAVFKELRAEFEICGLGSGVKALTSAKKRCGLAIGAGLCAVLLIFSQNRVISVEVLTDDENIRKKVTETLDSCGISAGTYIPSIERVKAERLLRQSVDEISWAGISLTDCSVIVDIVEDIPQPKNADDRLPSDLVASHDAVIDKLEIYNGNAVKTVGSGVTEGEVLVSGKVPVIHNTRDKEGRPMIEESEKIVRSIGKVYGTFSVTESFTQPLSEKRLIYSSGSKSRKYLKFFSADIPLYFKDSAGFISKKEKYSPLVILGEEFPIGITTETLSPYTFQTVLYTQKQAEQMVYLADKRYVRNFLDSYEIKNRSEKITQDNDSVTLTVTYELYGVISEERAFYSPELKSVTHNDQSGEKEKENSSDEDAD